MATWSAAAGWQTPVEPVAAAPSSFLDTVGISRQVPGITLHSDSEVRTLEELAAVTAAFRSLKAERHEERARRIRVPMGASLDTLRRAMASRAWQRGRAAGWRARWQTAAECGTRSAWLATCAGCDSSREPVALRCGLPRECPTCRGKELGRRVERIGLQLDAGRRARAAECARKGPTKARPLGRWAWRFVSFTIPPAAGVGKDAADIRKAFAILQRQLNAWIRKEGHELRPSFVLSSVEGTPGVSRHGHVHLHALVMSPYVPRALLRRWWGDALIKTDGRRRATMPYEAPGEASKGIGHAPSVRLLTHTRRGAAGRPLLSIPAPVLDIRAANDESIRELAKYAVKGIYQPNESQLAAWADVYCSLASVRLYASSRTLAALVIAETVKPIERLSCEACGLVGDWHHTTKRQRGPPEGARAFSCRAVIGLA